MKIVIIIIVILVIIRVIGGIIYYNRMSKATSVLKKIPELQPKANVYYGSTYSSKDAIILLDTEVIVNVVLDCVHQLRLNKEKPLSSNNLKKLIDKIFKHKDIPVNLPNFDCIGTQTVIELMHVTTIFGGENDVHCYPGTVAALLSRGYATELLGGHPPSSSLTKKMVEIANSKFVNLGKL